MRAIYSEIVTLGGMLLVIRATNATIERTFSAPRRQKTYLRSAMTQTIDWTVSCLCMYYGENRRSRPDRKN